MDLQAWFDLRIEHAKEGDEVLRTVAFLGPPDDLASGHV